MDQGRLQKRAINTKAEDPRQDLQSKAKHQNAAKQENEAGQGRDDHGQAVVGTTDRGGHHGQTVVVSTPVGEPFPPTARFSLLRLFGSRRCCVFCF